MREPVTSTDPSRTLDGQLQLRIPSRAEWVSVARLAVAGIAHRIEATIDEVEDLKLAVAEACTNCIQHAQGNDEVLVTFEIAGRRLTMVVEDGGKGFDGGHNRREAGDGSRPQVVAMGEATGDDDGVHPT